MKEKIIEILEKEYGELFESKKYTYSNIIQIFKLLSQSQSQKIDWEKVEKDFHYYMVNTFRLGLSTKDFDLTIKFFKSQPQPQPKEDEVREKIKLFMDSFDSKLWVKGNNITCDYPAVETRKILEECFNEHFLNSNTK